jgi:hypothetical protein
MKTLRLYGAGLLVALLLALAACGASGGGSGGGGGGSGSGAGTTWTLRFPGFNDLNGVTYGNGLFVAVGEGGTILTSPDGASWTRRTSGTSNRLRGVTYGNGPSWRWGRAAPSSPPRTG